MLQVNVIGPLVGQVHVFGEDDIENWDDIFPLFDTDPCTFSLLYDDITYTGIIAKSVDGTKLLVTFDQPNITLPSGMCLFADCPEPVEDPCPNVQQEITDETKFAILGEDGCQIGFVTYADIKEKIMECIPKTLCELIGEDGIPEGDLTAQDRILTTTDGCDLKSVPQSDIACPE